MRIFNESKLSDFLSNRENKAKQTVMSASREELGADDAKFINDAVRKYQLAPLVFDWDKVEVSSREDKVPARNVPGNFGRYQGQEVNVQVITFHLPYQGDSDLLRCQPGNRLLWSCDVVYYGQPTMIAFDVQNSHGDAKRVEEEGRDILDKIRQQAANVNAEVAQFNDNLRKMIPEANRSRREALQKQADTLKSIGFPVRK